MNVLVLQMFLISAEVSGNITEAVRNHTGKEPERMNRLRKIFKNMKYRHKLTILLVVTSLVPMTVLALYSHSRQSTMVRSSELEDIKKKISIIILLTRSIRRLRIHFCPYRNLITMRSTGFSFLPTVFRSNMNIHLFHLTKCRKSGGVKG